MTTLVSAQPHAVPAAVRAGSDDGRAAPIPPAAPLDAPLDRRVRAALGRAVHALRRKLRSDHGGPGRLHWCAELEGDSILSSEYLLMKFILGQEGEPDEQARLQRIANQLRLCQRGDGTWGQYPGSPPDVSACVKAYLSLKLMGDPVGAPHLARARERIRELGGAEACNTFSTFYLACLGLVSWDACPAIPPQIVLLPRWFPFHLDKVAAWTRTMILPLALCSATRPVRALPGGVTIDELFLDPGFKSRMNKPWDRERPVSWTNFFLLADRLLKACRRAGFTPLRRTSIRRAEAWLLERMGEPTTEGLGAIFPPMVYIQVALRRLGYPRTHPALRKAESDLDAFMIDERHPDPRLDHVRIQPCFSPVWDSSIALYAATEAGLSAAGDERIARVCDWLRDREVLVAGDHTRNLRAADRGLRPGVDTAMWAFEYRNDWYPDVDDTCMTAKALFRAGDRPGEALNRDAARRAVRWIMAMQNDDGGWAAFDRTAHRQWMEAIPFADHNAMQDPSCPDITGRVLESLAVCGVRPGDPRVRAAAAYLLAHQEPEGCWIGRWGVNYIYGTWQAVTGLRSAGVGPEHPALRRALAWVRSTQNDDGGFGESADSYLDRARMGRGASTASQTAWGLMTLLHLLGPGAATDPAVGRAAGWLCDHQLARDKGPFEAAACVNPGCRDAGTAEFASIDHVRDLEGAWSEHLFTGTGFPKVFYLRYHLYRHSFPIMALARLAGVLGPAGA